MLRTTCLATMLEGGHASNALHISVKIGRVSAPGPVSRLRPDVLKQITRISDTLWLGVMVVLTIVNGRTDGRPSGNWD